MSSHSGFPTNGFFLILKVSRLQLIQFIAAFSLALFSIWWSAAFTIPLAIAITLVLCISAGHFLHREILRWSPDALVAVNHGEGQWRLTLRSGEIVPALFVRSSHIGRFFMALEFRLTDGSKRTVTLLSDAIAPDTFRRLRVMLKFGALA